MVICKPCKDDYRQLKAYYPISLLSFKGQVVKMIDTSVLSEDAERGGLLCDGQFGQSNGW
jgi:hypothetical protein